MRSASEGLHALHAESGMAVPVPRAGFEDARCTVRPKRGFPLLLVTIFGHNRCSWEYAIVSDSKQQVRAKP